MTISDNAMLVLEALIELQNAGMISGDETSLVETGYEPGSLEVRTPAVVTYEGRNFKKGTAG